MRRKGEWFRVPNGEYYYQPVTYSNNSSSLTWNSNSTIQYYQTPQYSGVAYAITPVPAALPVPMTAVEQLWAEVESVCALAR